MALRWLIYGAYGYSGHLIAQQAKKLGYSPVLGGRNAAKLETVANRLELPFQTFSLDNPSDIEKALKHVDLVINCAGPFQYTAAQLITACLATKTHYLDITGEIEVFELAHQYAQQAREAGVVLCPGVGFDVIPTDCVAARLNAQVPDAEYLALGFDSTSQMSQGTAKTSIERLSKGGAVRRNGVIENVPLAYHTRTIDFGRGEKLAMTIPWGDVSTAYYTTEIPNIEVYVPASPKLVKRLRMINWFRWLFSFAWVKKRLIDKVKDQPAGPDTQERKNNPTYVWGEVRNAKGYTKSLKVKVKNGYSVTAEGAVMLAVYTLQNPQKGGFYTPSRLYGAKLLDAFIVE